MASLRLRGWRQLRLALAALALAMVLMPPQSGLANGWPPYGAWAYGSGIAAPGVARYRSVYRTGFRGNSYASVRASYRAFGSVGWSPNYSRYRVVTRRYSPVFYTPIHYFPRYYSVVYPAYSAYYSCFPRVVPIAYPTFHYSTFRYSYSPLLIGYGSYPCLTMTAQPISVNFANQPPRSSRLTPSLAGQTNASKPQLVAPSPSASKQVPQKLLAAADAIFQAGGFRQAAVAYAQLSVRYDSTPELMTRRFACHVLNQDFGQAEVVVSLSEAMGISMSADFLGQDNLNSIAAADMRRYSELLAQRALQKTQDSAALLSVGNWLALGNQPERAQLFIAASKKLISSPDTNPVAPADDVVKTPNHYVASTRVN